MSSFDPSWIPPEAPDVLFNERTWLAGMVLTAVGYGVVLTLFINTAHILVSTRATGSYKSKAFWLVYVSLMLLFGTLYVGAAAKMTELSYIDYRLFPGGPCQCPIISSKSLTPIPANFEEVEFSIPIDEMGNVAFVLANWFADAVVVPTSHFSSTSHSLDLGRFGGSRSSISILAFRPGLL